jgi:hypothetical protein
MIKIISTHLSDSRFVYFQKKLLDKFILDDFEFIVFDDSKNDRNGGNKGSDSFLLYAGDTIKKVCSDLSVKRIEIPNSIHSDPSLVHKEPSFIFNDSCGWCANSVQFSVNWCFDNLDPSDIVLSIDGDMFPISNISISEFMKDFNLSGVPQNREGVEYLWNGIFGFRVGEIERDLFQWGTIVPCDVGGMMQFYLEKNPDYKKIWHLWSCSWNMDSLLENGELKEPHINKFLQTLDYEIPESIRSFTDHDPRNIQRGDATMLFSEIYHPGFIHYRAGGNWDGFNSHESRKEHLFNFFNILLNE